MKKLFVSFLLLAHAAMAGFLTVSNSNDSGSGSLRQAILDSNAMGGTNTISFNGPFPVVINLGSAITVTTPIDMSGVGAVELVGGGLDIASGDCTITELTINSCTTALVLRDKGNNTVQGCFLGTDMTGTIAKPNTTGLLIQNSSFNSIEGFFGPGVISGNTGDGILITGSSAGNVIISQRIGTDVGGTNALPNGGNGLHVMNAGNTAVGGFFEECVISANGANGVLVENSGPMNLSESYIGTDFGGSNELGNALSGVVISDTSNCHLGGNFFLVVSGNGHYGIEILGSSSTSNQIGFGEVFIGAGPSTNDLGNTLGGILFSGASGNYIDSTKTTFIAFNKGPGMIVHAGTNDASGTHVSFLSNTGPGISLEAGGNNLLNAPVITKVITNSPTSLTVSGTLAAAASTLYFVEVYSTPACNQGAKFLGQTIVITGSSGTSTWGTTVTGTFAPGTLITALTRYNPAFNFFRQDVSEFTQICEPAPQLEALEVIQSVQDWNNSITLVTGKTTFVRAFIEGGNDYLTGKLHGFRNNVELPDSPLPPLNAGGRVLPSTIAADQRGLWTRSLNFRLPPGWTTSEGVVLQLVASNFCSHPADCKVTANFVAQPVPSVVFIPFKYPEGPDSLNYDGPYIQPSEAEITAMGELLRVAYPVHDVKYRSEEPERVGHALREVEIDAFNDFVQLRRTRDGCLSPQCKDLYYGVTKGGPEGLGKCNEIPGDLASGTIDGIPFSYSSTTHLHELSHSLGNSHAVTNSPIPGVAKRGVCSEEASSIAPTFPYFSVIDGRLRATLGPMDGSVGEQVFGLDTSDPDNPKVVNPNLTFENMSYCEGLVQGRKWPSKFNYEALVTGISTRFQPSAPRPAGLQVEQNYLLVAGTINTNTEEASLYPFGRITTTDTPASPDPGSASLQLLDAGSNVVTEVSFEPTIGAPEVGAQETSVGSFLILVPANAQYHQAIVRHNGNVVITRTASANAPTVNILSPNGGETIPNGQTFIQWEASDADGDPLTFTAQYSPDGGATWTTLGLNLVNPILLVDTRSLSGSTNALIRVEASDGFNTGTDVSDAPFTVANHAPSIEIKSPTEQQLFAGEQAVVLEALVKDIEDGTAGVQWSSSLDGALGSGKILLLNANSLSAGTHTISAIATDSQSATATDSVTIVVASEVPASLADISLIKSASTNASTIVYTLTVENNGPNDATGATLTDVLPATLDFSSGDTTQGSCNENAGAVTCNLGTIVAGSNAVVRIFATANTTAIHTNTASVAGIETDPTPANNSATATISASPPPVAANDLALTKLKAPKKITFKPGVASVTGKFGATIQNLGPGNEVIPDFATLQNLVTVTAQSLGGCPDVSATMTLPKPAFPITLAPKKKLNLAFTAAFTTNCINDAGAGTPDYRATGSLNLSGDPSSANNNCPRVPGIDKGCKEILIDAIVK